MSDCKKTDVKDSNMRFLIWGYYGHRNTGDEIMLSVIIDCLRKEYKGCSIKVKTKTPIETARKYNVETIFETMERKNSLKEKIDIIKALMQTNVFLMGGGTIIHEHYNSSWRSIFYLFKLSVIAKFFGKKIIFFGIGIGEVDTQMGKFLTKCLISFSDLVILRDRYSRESLQRLNCNFSKVKVTQDLAFLINTGEKNIQADLRNHRHLRIGVSVLPFYAYEQNDRIANEEMAVVMANALGELAHLFNGELYFISMQDEERISDKEYARVIVKYIKRDVKTHILDYNDNFQETTMMISNMDIMIGMRLHSLILSFINKVPVVAISYNPKVKSIMKDAGLENQCVDIRDLSVEEIISLFKIAYNTQDEYKRNIGDKLLLWRTIAQKSILYLKGKIPDKL